MNQPKAKITYLFHSGFAVETKDHYFIFDYYQPRPAGSGKLSDGIITGEYLKTKANVFVFASHNHSDHFDRVILKWAESCPDITYILNSDIPVTGKLPHFHSMSPYEEWEHNGVQVKSFGSTDAGGSFLVQADGVTIFHAGDLNWWHWPDDTQEESDYAESFFKSEMEKIGKPEIDIAFFPVDQRLEQFYSLGAEYFAAVLRPKLLIPMHFGDTYSTTKAFAEKVKGAQATVEISHRGQEFYF